MNLVSLLIFGLISIPSNTAESIDGYRGVKWNASYKVAVAKIKTNQDRRCDRLDLISSGDVADLIKRKTKLVGVKMKGNDFPDEPLSFVKNFKYLPLDKGCGLFYKDKFIAFESKLHGDNFKDVSDALSKKYGHPKIENLPAIFGSREVYLFEQKEGSIFLFEYRGKVSKSPQIFYVSNKIDFLADDLKIAKENEKNKKIEMENKRKKELSEL